MKYYSVDDYTKGLINQDYVGFTVQEGVLNDTVLYVHPNTIKALKDGTDNTQYIILVTPHYQNEWQNMFTIKRFKKLPKKYEHLINF